MQSSTIPKKVSMEVLRGPKLKLERGKRYIDEIQSCVAAMPSDWFKLECHNGTTSYIRYTPLMPIPDLFALMIGDATHNLRSALDHLATGIVRTIKPNASPYFPMCKNRDSIIGDKMISARLDAIDEALPGSRDLFLNKIRPAGSGTDLYWSFHAIDNDDKHSLIVPTVTVADVRFSGNADGTVYTSCGGGDDAARQFIPLISYEPIRFFGEPKLSIDLRFGAQTPFESKLVVPTLNHVADLVSNTIDEFSNLISRQP